MALVVWNLEYERETRGHWLMAKSDDRAPFPNLLGEKYRQQMALGRDL